MKPQLLFIFLFSIFCNVSLAQNQQPVFPCNEMPAIMLAYEADVGSLNNVYVADNSPEMITRYQSLAKEYLTKLDKINFNSLNQDCKADYVLFKRDLQKTVDDENNNQQEYDRMKKWFPFADSLYAIEKVRRRGGNADGERVAKIFHAATKSIEDLQKQLKEEKQVSVTDSRRAQLIISGLKTATKSSFDFYNTYDPLFTWWVPDTYKSLDAALTAYAKSFDEAAQKTATNQDESGIVGYPIGREAFISNLKYELINYTPEELIDIANKEFAWCENEMQKASKEMGFGNDWKKALEAVKLNNVAPGTQAEAIVKILDSTLDFIKSKDLLTIPKLAEETWRIRMMSPEVQRFLPFFYGGREFAVAYPTNTMDHDDRIMAMRGNNLNFSKAIVHHETIPGHFMQYYMNNRYNTYRNYRTPFWTEGWALYWEFLLWDEGFPKTPQDRVGMLFWRMHRCARIIFSINYHMGKWSPQQCIDFLVDKVGHERANAEGEVRRSFEGNYGPLYQIGYMLGGIQIMGLKNEALAKGMKIKDFHDKFMTLNSMPIEMVRNIILEKPIDKNYKTNWRFYDQRN